MTASTICHIDVWSFESAISNPCVIDNRDT